ncbi:MAG: PASTA domain-containing protein [Thermoleophilia bacterium]
MRTGHGRDGPTFAFAWLRDGAPIGGAAGAQYLLAPADASAAVQCQVTATNVIGSTTAVTAPVGIDALPVPTATSAPAIAGAGRRGLVVTCTNGVCASATTFAFAWLRNGLPIAGATATSLKLGARDVGRAVQCRVTASGPGGTAVVDSAPIVGADACIVPRLRGATLAQARARLARAGCAVGRVSTTVTRAVGPGRVLRSRPAAGANRPLGAKVRLTLGRRP